MTEKIHDILCGIFTYIMILLLGGLTFISLISTTFVNDHDEVYYISDRPWVHLLSLILILGAGYFIFVKMGLKLTDRMVISAIVCFTVMAGIYVTMTGLVPRFDQRAVRAVAGDLAYGITDDYLPGGYAEIYPYQNGLILFYEAVIKIFGYENHVVMQYINLFFMAATEAGIILLSKRHSFYYREITMGFILFLPYWGFVSFLYGNIPGYACGIWALYFGSMFLKDRRIWAALPSGVLCSLACIFKLNFAILLIAIGIYTLMDMMKRGGIWKAVLIISMVLFYVIGGKAVDATIEARIGHELTEGIPGLPYIAMGLHEHSTRGAGWHDNYPEDTYEEIGHDPEISTERAKEDIRNTLADFRAHKAYMIGFFERKVASMWNEPTYYSWSLQQGRDQELDKSLFYPGIPFVTFFTDQFQTLLYGAALFYFIKHRKDRDFGKLFFALYFVGGFLCHLLWEAQSQYAMLYAMGLTPYSVMGCRDLCRGAEGLMASKDRVKILRICLILAAVVLILSIPALSRVLTLSRDDLRFAEYMAAPY